MTANFKDFEYAAGQVADWPDPIAFRETVGPAFPVEALPGDLAEFVKAQSIAIQIPHGATATLVLGTLSAAAAGRAKVVLRSDWNEPLNSYVVVSLPSGERKSPLFRQTVRPLERHEAAIVKTVVAAQAEARAKRAVLEQKQKTATKAATSAKNEQDRQAAEQLTVDLARAIEDIELPAMPRLLADDATPEVVARLLSEQGGRIAIASDEGGLFETIAGRYANGVANLDVFLKGHSGDALRVDRLNRPPLFIPEPTLTMVLAVQPDVLHQAVKRQEFKGRGFLARWLYELSPSLVGWRDNDPPPVPEHLDQRWDRSLDRLLSLPADGVLRLALSPEAAAEFSRFRKSVEERMRPGGDFDPIRDWANKLPGHVARLGGILQLWGWASGEDAATEPGTEVRASVMTSAIALGEHYAEHAAVALGFGTLDADTPRAEAVWRYIQSKSLGGFDFHGLHQCLRRSFSVPDLERALAILEDLCYVRKLPVSTRKGPGRPPSAKYEVNPRAFESRTRNPRNDGAAAGGGMYEDRIT